ncbi:MSHA biogenesis protein MshK [Janthinobacterium sp. BJB1]|nr:MSHA biogenesis protein MshK [Janthinobacterium sp. GW458P]PHV14727.1 MSHA biogenesis protein MshK [Janthinobacterium sp. BJB303]PJD00166.1 MSHA biogenesis protein MshK [Janthinobacterium sp. BJB1]
MRARCRIALAGALLALAPGAFAQALADPTRPPDAPPVQGGAATAGAARPQLQSVLIANQPGGRRLAVIDGRSVRAGDKLDGAVVVGIGEASVTLRRGKTLETLRLYPKAVDANDAMHVRRKQVHVTQ